MFSKDFGNYLYNKNLVTSEQLTDAMNEKDAQHVRLGVLAINAGYLSAAQVAKIHEAQSKVDLKFGELAVKMNYLTESQLDRLLGTQKQWHLLLGQTMVEKQYMSLEQFESALDEYKEENSLSEIQLQEENIEEILKKILDFGDPPSEKMLFDYISLFVRSLIRFMDETPRLETNITIQEFSTPYLVYQGVYGPVNLFTAIASDKEVFKNLAERFAHQSFKTINKWSKSSVAEFLNLHNGIFLVNMSNKGIELETKPQKTLENIHLTGIEKGYAIPVYLSSGKFDLIIAEAVPSFS